MIAAGTLDQIIRLLEPNAQLDLFGSPVSQYTEVGVRRAALVKQSWRDAERDPGRTSTADLILSMREDALTRRITTDWKFEHEGYRYSVVGVRLERGARTVVITGSGAEIADG